MKVSLICHYLLPGEKYNYIGYAVQEAMSVFWGIRNQGHTVQLINASEPIEKIIFKLKVFKPDIIYNLSEGISNSPTRVALYPELFERLRIPYIGGSGFLVTVGFNKHLSKLYASGMGMKMPKSNLYFLDSESKKIVEVGNWNIKYPAIIKPNTRNCSAGITSESIVHNKRDMLRVLKKRLKKYPEGILVEEFIEGKEIGVCYLKGYGNDCVLFPIELVTDRELKNPYNIVDYATKNYALKKNNVKHLSARLAENLPPKVIKKIQISAKKIFESFEVKDFGRIDMRVTPKGEIYFLEINPDITMSNGTHMFYAANKKHGLSYGEVFDVIIKNAAERWKIPFYKSNRKFFSNIIYKLLGKYYFLKFKGVYYKEP